MHINGDWRCISIAHGPRFIDSIVYNLENFLTKYSKPNELISKNRMGHKSLNISFNNLSRNAVMHIQRTQNG